MSPVFQRYDGYVFKIFSNEEARIHIHVIQAEKEAKYWLEPEISLAENFGFNNKELSKIEKFIHQHADEFKTRYIQHIGRRLDD